MNYRTFQFDCVRFWIRFYLGKYIGEPQLSPFIFILVLFLWTNCRANEEMFGFSYVLKKSFEFPIDWRKKIFFKVFEIFFGKMPMNP